MPHALSTISSRASVPNRAPLISGGFKRVSKRRPCRICGKPTYCGFSTDERVSICMRVSTGSRGPSRNGGNIHVHYNIPFTGSRQEVATNPASIPLAPLEIRDAVFRELMRLSPAFNYREELLTGPGGLLSRGLLEEHAFNYGALPPTKRQRATLANVLRCFVQKHFPDYTKLYSGGVIGIPGFWQEASGLVHLWKLRDYLMPILVIPYKNKNGLIQACQIRLHANDLSAGEKRYRWLSSPLERRGISSGTPIHFAFAPQRLSGGETVVITEGALKADTLVRFRPKARVIATSGVSCSHNEIVEAARRYNALIAFDADHRINPAVCRQLARLIVQRHRDSTKHGLSVSTKILFWNGPNGIDDAVRANMKLSALTVSKWYDTLENEPLEEVNRFWKEAGFKFKE